MSKTLARLVAPGSALCLVAGLLLTGMSGAAPASASVTQAATPTPTPVRSPSSVPIRRPKATVSPTPSTTRSYSVSPRPRATRPVPPHTSVPRRPVTPAGFVYRSGRNLMLDGRKYHFVGFNAFGMTGCATNVAWTRAELDAYFAGLPPASMTRTWAFAGWEVDKLDLIVERATAHGQKLILSLANQGKDCREEAKDKAWYEGGYKAAYLPWVNTVVTRYKDSAAIGMWEIINEPGYKTVGVTTEMIKNFLDETAAYIKARDRFHLVTSGTMAEYTEGTGNATNYGLLHAGPNIDVGSLHEYDENHADQVISRHLGPTLSQLYKLNKPIIVGESGIVAGPPGCSITTQQRSAMFKKEFDGYFLSGVGGVMIWTYSPNPRDLTDPEQLCMHQVRAPDPDPAIAMVRGYTLPAPVPAPTGERQLQLLSSGQCAQATAVQKPCDAAAADQRFTLRPTTDGFVRLVAKSSGHCLGVGDLDVTLRALVSATPCADGAEGAGQQFRLEAVANGYHRLIFRHSNQCVTINPDGRLQQFDCKTPALTSQQWKIQ
ncbi:cellulase family glycosylhydrolase [Nonomuraea jiangxiensis]|uniref:mannan endo-1,4-beta-mannosidase n=1 Tax=Nonomuraea jiangxiensis TaxID=633440 RepID=A0A1G9F5F3_9ACTN|nr:cellulase family glycosylhydrolase [Nonomuraea jiangxiensis]SDK83637.1 Cellulase (glycosyl hydrolase family 5) [Nonomuraea jiangxiensis]